MSIPFLNDINLNQSELLNGVIHKSTSATRPATPVLGQVTYDTDLKTIMSWNGTAWVSVSDTDAVLSISATGTDTPINVSEDGNRNVDITIDDATATTRGVIRLAGDLAPDGTNGAEEPRVATVGGASAADIADAASKRHTQNTDTGTTGSSFTIDSDAASPVVLNNNAGVLELTDGSSNFRDLKVKNLTVTGTTTQVDSNEVNIGDSELLLNSDVAANAQNSDGGIAIKRLQSDDTTRADAKNYFDNTTGLWKVTQGAVDDLQTFQVARKFVSAAIGDGSAKDFVITHNLNTRDVQVAIRRVASPYELVLTDVECTSVDTITVKFKNAPTAGQFVVTVIG